VTTGDVPVNFVHRDDVVGVVDAVVAKNQWGQIYNVVAPLHPIRRDIYLKNAKMFGFAPPIFKEPAEPNPYKRISVQKLIGELGYRFKFPDPMDFEYTGLPTADGIAKDPHEQADLY
jgi:nucleoside-diphosphate-sugar epimerase